MTGVLLREAETHRGEKPCEEGAVAMHLHTKASQGVPVASRTYDKGKEQILLLILQRKGGSAGTSDFRFRPLELRQ